MQLVIPDILADTCGLSPPLLISGLVIGLALWLFGWSCHRFWIVLITTVLAGIYGLYEAPALRAQPLVAAVLLALTAGMLALALVRLVAFVAGGTAGLLAAQAVIPTFDQPLICFLVSGLIGLFLFRFSMMALSSVAGAIFIAYAGLGLLTHYGAMDAVAWSEQGGTLLNWICALMGFVGLTFQFYRNRRRQDKYERDHDSRGQDAWEFLLGRRSKSAWGRSYRKAG